MENRDFEVSIIIPVYHVETPLLCRCLSSINNVGIAKEVLIVVDGKGLPREKAMLLQAYQKAAQYQVKIYVTDHKGVAAARNHGLLNAEGSWIFFLDADDYLIPEGFAGSEYYMRNPSTDLIIMDYNVETFDVCRKHVYGKSSSQSVSYDTLLEDILNPQSGAGFVWGKLFRRKWLEEKQLFFNEKMAVAEDADFMLRAALTGPGTIYVRKTCYSYWRNRNSAVHKYRMDYAERYIYGMEQLKNDLLSAAEYENMEGAYAGCVLYHLLLIAVNDSFHPDNPNSGEKRREQFKKLVKMEIFKTAIQKAYIKNFSVSRKITIFFIRMHCYRFVQAIAVIRHRQFQAVREKYV